MSVKKGVDSKVGDGDGDVEMKELERTTKRESKVFAEMLKHIKNRPKEPETENGDDETLNVGDGDGDGDGKNNDEKMPRKDDMMDEKDEESVKAADLNEHGAVLDKKANEAETHEDGDGNGDGDDDGDGDGDGKGSTADANENDEAAIDALKTGKDEAKATLGETNVNVKSGDGDNDVAKVKQKPSREEKRSGKVFGELQKLLSKVELENGEDDEEISDDGGGDGDGDEVTPGEGKDVLDKGSNAKPKSEQGNDGPRDGDGDEVTPGQGQDVLDEESNAKPISEEGNDGPRDGDGPGDGDGPRDDDDEVTPGQGQDVLDKESNAKPKSEEGDGPADSVVEKNVGINALAIGVIEEDDEETNVHDVVAKLEVRDVMML